MRPRSGNRQYIFERRFLNGRRTEARKKAERLCENRQGIPHLYLPRKCNRYGGRRYHRRRVYSYRKFAGKRYTYADNRRDNGGHQSQIHRHNAPVVVFRIAEGSDTRRQLFTGDHHFPADRNMRVRYREDNERHQGQDDQKEGRSSRSSPAPDPQLVLLTEIRDLLKAQAAYYEVDSTVDTNENTDE